MNQNLNLQNNGVNNNPFEIFDYQNLGQVRVSTLATGEPLFCLVDVCNILGIKNSRRTMERLMVDGVHTMNVIDSMGRLQQATFVDQGNLFKIIFTSRKPEAQNFANWVSYEVLPSLMNRGYYTMPNMSPMEMIRTMADEMINMKNDYTNQFQLVDQRVTNIDNTVNDHTHMIENINNTISLLETEGFFTVSGFARFVSVPLTQELAIHIGKVASEIASNNGIQIGSLPHPEFGSVRLYPYNVISEAFRVSGQVNN